MIQCVDSLCEQCKDTEIFAIFARLCACSMGQSANNMNNN